MILDFTIADLRFFKMKDIIFLYPAFISLLIACCIALLYVLNFIEQGAGFEQNITNYAMRSTAQKFAAVQV